MNPMANPAPPAPAPIVAKDVGYRHGGGFALDAVSFTVARGQSVGLVGRNGAGKTTLLRCLLDFTRPQSGAIRIAGIDSREPSARRGLAWLPERFVPPPHLSGADYLRLQAGLRGMPYDPKAAHECLRSLGFDTAALARSARHYSKGMAQTLGLASALLARAELTVLDEPTSGLDPAARARSRAALHALRAEGRTLLFSSHALDDVATLCDRVLVLDGGRLVLDTTPAAWLEGRPPGTPLETVFLATIGEPAA